jgi:Tfp pilus assembly protein PilN
MIAPNLASRPHLNARPVWIVTAAAGLLALVFAAANVQIWLSSNRSVGEQLVRLEELEAEYQALTTEVTEQATELRKIPWRSLADRITAVNSVIREHDFSWIGLLNDIENVLPYEVRLTRIAPKVDVEEVNLSLVAIGRTREALLDFLDNLIADPRFSDPNPMSEITPEESGVGYMLNLTVKHHPEEPTS